LSTVTTAASRDRTCTTRLCTTAELGEMLVVARNLLHRRSPPAHDLWPITPALRHDVKCAQITLRSPRWVLRGVAPLGFTSTCQDRPRMHKHVCTRHSVGRVVIVDRSMRSSEVVGQVLLVNQHSQLTLARLCCCLRIGLRVAAVSLSA
jgi:hypothetical protein